MENNQIDLINKELKEWCQGDFVLGEQLFVHRFNPQCPLTSDSKNLEEDEQIDLVESEVKGLIVVTQTCDIVRRCNDRPFLEVAPLVDINPLLSDSEKWGSNPYSFVRYRCL